MAEGKETACPDALTLQRAFEGSLSPNEQAEVMAHVARCAECQEDRRTLDDACALLLSETPERLAEQERFYAAFELRLQALKQERQLERELEQERQRRARARWRRWLSVGVLVPLTASLALAVFVTPPSEVVVHADTLITQAAQADLKQPAGWTQRVRMRLTPDATASSHPSEWTFESCPNARIDATDHATDPSTSVPATAAQLLLALRMTRGGASAPPFDRCAPLAVTHFQTWRTTLPDRRDTVTEVGRFLVLRTIAPAGATIKESELAVDRDSYRVVRQSWVVAWLGRLDIEEVDAWVAPVVPPRPIDRAALERAELAARVALRVTELDLGGIQIRQSEAPAGVEIDGPVPSQSARDALAARLTTIREIRLDVQVTATTTTSASARRGARLAADLQAEYGAGAEDRAALVPDITRRAPRVAQRLIAIQALGDRYSPEAIAKLPPDAQSTLRHLIEAHFTALHTDMIALDNQLATFIGSAGRPIPSSHPPQEWRSCTRGALREARALSALLTPAKAPVPTEVRVHLDALWRQLNPPTPMP